MRQIYHKKDTLTVRTFSGYLEVTDKPNRNVT